MTLPGSSTRSHATVRPIAKPSDPHHGTFIYARISPSGEATGMATRTVVHFEIPATDPDRLRRFYSDCFGWEFRDAGAPGMQYWIIRTGPVGRSVGGGMYPKMRPDDRPRNFIGVDRIDDAIQRFREAGGRQVVEKMEVPGQGWSFIGADPEGNVIALWEPKMAQPARPQRARKRAASVRRRARPRRRAVGRRRK
jgi:hypothetical protein